MSLIDRKLGVFEGDIPAWIMAAIRTLTQTEAPDEPGDHEPQQRSNGHDQQARRYHTPD